MRTIIHELGPIPHDDPGSRGVRLQMDNATKFVSEIVRFTGDPEDGEGHAMRQIAARFAMGGDITQEEREQLSEHIRPGQLVVDDLPF